MNFLKTTSLAGINAFYNTAGFLLLFVVPSVLFCIALLLISRWMDGRLMKTFGWRGILLFSWLGTPVHELSHLVACIIGRNEIVEFKLFKPDKETGSLGHVYHAYNKKSFYQRVIGNSLISIAPFFGGSLVIFLLTWLLYPELIASSETLTKLELASLTNLDSLGDSIKYIADNALSFWQMLFSLENITDWKFWLYLFTMISVAFRLSPSPSDFEGFWWPFILIMAIIYLVHFVLELFEKGTITQQGFVSEYLTSLYGLLTLALLFLTTAAIFITLITFVFNVAFKRKQA